MSNAFGQCTIKANGLNTVDFLWYVDHYAKECGDKIKKKINKICQFVVCVCVRVQCAWIVFCGPSINLDMFPLRFFSHHDWIGRFTNSKAIDDIL